MSHCKGIDIPGEAVLGYVLAVRYCVALLLWCVPLVGSLMVVGWAILNLFIEPTPESFAVMWLLIVGGKATLSAVFGKKISLVIAAVLGLVVLSISTNCVARGAVAVFGATAGIIDWLW